MHLLSYKLTGATAMVVLYVDVSDDSSFRHVYHELTVADPRRINMDFEDG